MYYISNLPKHNKIYIKDLLGIYREEKHFKPKNQLLDVFDKSRLIRESGKGFTKIDKAKNILGYAPNIDFNDGIKLTKEWLKFSRII
jgi:nucleoside-diphosphate-sugar epimerase